MKTNTADPLSYKSICCDTRTKQNRMPSAMQHTHSHIHTHILHAHAPVGP